MAHIKLIATMIRSTLVAYRYSVLKVTFTSGMSNCLFTTSFSCVGRCAYASSPSLTSGTLTIWESTSFSCAMPSEDEPDECGPCSSCFSPTRSPADEDSSCEPRLSCFSMFAPTSRVALLRSPAVLSIINDHQEDSSRGKCVSQAFGQERCGLHD